jgi:hypothetical protein
MIADIHIDLGMLEAGRRGYADAMAINYEAARGGRDHRETTAILAKAAPVWAAIGTLYYNDPRLVDEALVRSLREQLKHTHLFDYVDGREFVILSDVYGNFANVR